MPKGTPKNGTNSGWFKSGVVSWNKGTVGVMKPNSGSFTKGHQMTEEQRKAVSQKMKKLNTWMLGRKLSEETKKKMSESAKKRGTPTHAIRYGEEHHNWKGGVTTINEKIRKSKKYKDWRKSVFMRDNFSCVECGKTKTYVQAHHVKSFSQYPDLRFDIDNGVTLCKKCHLGNGRHTKEKLI